MMRFFAARLSIVGIPRPVSSPYIKPEIIAPLICHPIGFVSGLERGYVCLRKANFHCDPSPKNFAPHLRQRNYKVWKNLEQEGKEIIV
jgi:hypothetical protein